MMEIPRAMRRYLQQYLGLTHKVQSDQLGRFLGSSDNLILALLGLPFALTFQQITTAWLPDRVYYDPVRHWLVPAFGVLLLFVLFAVALGVSSYILVYWKEYREQKPAFAHLFLIIVAILVISSVLMGSAVDESALTQIAGKAWLDSVSSNRQFIVFLVMFTSSLLGAVIIITPDLFEVDFAALGQPAVGHHSANVSFIKVILVTVPFVVFWLAFCLTVL